MMARKLIVLCAWAFAIVGWEWSPRTALGEPAQPSTMIAPETLPQGVILVVTDKSGLVKPDSPLYLASNHGGWNPGNAALKLSGRSDGRWQIALPKAPNAAPLEFKFTRGSWETVEIAADLSDVPNRRLSAVDPSKLKNDEPPLIELTIEKFADQRPGALATNLADPYRTVQVTGTVKRVQVFGGGAPSAVGREVLVWLPPGYTDRANGARTYPVLYLMDGQNVFEQLPGVPGEWKADEAATELINKGEIEPLIIVGVPHAGQWRMAEYCPWTGVQGVPALGEPFVAWLLSEVRPRVERSFRIKTGAENTAIGGASMGGLISLYAATRNPGVFGAVLAESPSLILGNKDLVKELVANTKSWPRRVYLGVGGRELTGDERAREANQRLVDAVKSVDAAAAAGGAAHVVVIEPDATHDENAWSHRFPEALKFLFPKPVK